jgi:hypothetical protein
MLIFLRSLVALIVIFLISAALIGAADTIPHREFSGPIIGAAGAVFAAWLAWEAVQRQIAATYDVAGMPARQVSTAIKEEIAPLIKALNVLWTILDDFIVFEGTNIERLSRSTWMSSTVMYSLPPDTIIDDLDAMGRLLPPDRRRRFDDVLLRLRILYKLMTRVSETRAERAGELDWRKHEFDILRIQFTQLKRSLEKYDEGLTQFFTNHVAIPLDESGWDDMLLSGYNLWKEEEVRRKEEGLAADEHLA